jgi:cytochrome c-type biogenesis protein CcmH/NrfG
MWRLGQAQLGAGTLGTAVDTLRRAARLAPTNKAVRGSGDAAGCWLLSEHAAVLGLHSLVATVVVCAHQAVRADHMLITC